MATETIDQKLKKLQAKFDKKVAVLEREVERAKAYAEIMALMGRMQYYHSIGKNYLIGEKIFAQQTPGVRLYFGENGSWEGIEAIKMVDRSGGGPPLDGEDARKGRMSMHLMLQPVIEVAGDGKTARATFWAAGLMAGKDRKTGEPSCGWEWNRYAEDFVKEDGKWKLWHHHVFPLFRIGWDQTWADAFKKNQNEITGGGMKFPEKLKKYYHPATPKDRFYDPNEVLPEIPPPDPYETWDDSMTT